MADNHAAETSALDRIRACDQVITKLDGFRSLLLTIAGEPNADEVIKDGILYLGNRLGDHLEELRNALWPPDQKAPTISREPQT